MKIQTRQAVHALVGTLWILGGCGATDALPPSDVRGDAGPDGPGSGGALGVGGQLATGGAQKAGGTMPAIKGGNPGAGGTLSPTGGNPSLGGAPGADGGASAGGTGGVAGCPFENTTIVWGPDGGRRRWAWHASLGPEGFERWTDDHVSGETSRVGMCKRPWPSLRCSTGATCDRWTETCSSSG
jgi:hypothetical protein